MTITTNIYLSRRAVENIKYAADKNTTKAYNRTSNIDF